MSERRDHNAFAKMLFPWVDEKLIDKINKEIDIPASYIGSSHRRERHDMKSAVILSMLEGGNPEVLLIANAHQILDRNRNLQKLVKVLGRV